METSPRIPTAQLDALTRVVMALIWSMPPERAAKAAAAMRWLASTHAPSNSPEHEEERQLQEAGLLHFIDAVAAMQPGEALLFGSLPGRPPGPPDEENAAQPGPPRT